MIKALLIGAMLYTSPSDSDKITNYEYKINEMILTIEDLHEWIRNDVDNGTLDPRLGEIYQDVTEVTEEGVITYVEH